MRVTRVEWHGAGMRSVLRSDQVRRHLEARMQRVADRARATAPVDDAEPHIRDNIKVDSRVGKNRVNARVVAETPYAAKVCAENPFFAAALDAAGD